MTSITFSEEESAVLSEALNLAIGYLIQLNDDPATSGNEKLLQLNQTRIVLYDTLRVKIREALYQEPGGQSKVN